MEKFFKNLKTSTALWIMSGVLLLQHFPSLLLPLWKRDEGYWWALGSAVARGEVLYRDAADNRSPLFVYIYSYAIRLFSDQVFPFLHLWVALGNLLILILLYRIGKQYFGEKIGLCVALFYLFLQGSFTAQETLAAHTENLGMPWVVAALFFYCRYLKEPRAGTLFLSGLFIGAAFQIRQTLGIQLAIQGFHLIFRSMEAGFSFKKVLRNVGEGAWLTAGFLVLPLFFVWHFYRVGALEDFVFWTFLWNQKYYVLGARELGFGKILWEAFWRTGVFMAACGGVWFLVLCSFRYWRSSFQEGSLWILLLLGHLLTVPIGWRFSHHYYIPLFPGAALLAGWLLHHRQALGVSMWPISPKILALTLLVPFLGFLGESLFYVASGRTAFGEDVSSVLGKKLKEKASSQDRLFIWGYHPAVYYYSGLPSASRFLVNQYHTWQIRLNNEFDPPSPVAVKLWVWLFDDFSRHPPEWILDTSSYTVSGRRLHPISRYPSLQKHILESYNEAGKIDEAVLYRRKSSELISKPIAQDP